MPIVIIRELKTNKNKVEYISAGEWKTMMFILNVKKAGNLELVKNYVYKRGLHKKKGIFG